MNKFYCIKTCFMCMFVYAYVAADWTEQLLVWVIFPCLQCSADGLVNKWTAGQLSVFEESFSVLSSVAAAHASLLCGTWKAPR